MGHLLTAASIYTRWRSGSPPSPVVDATLFGLVGVAGVVFVLMWFATDHVVTDKNWNLVWAWPTHVLAAIVVALRRKSRVATWYFALYVATVLVLSIGWFFWPQALPAAFLPIVLLLGLRAVRRVNVRMLGPFGSSGRSLTST